MVQRPNGKGGRKLTIQICDANHGHINDEPPFAIGPSKPVDLIITYWETLWAQAS